MELDDNIGQDHGRDPRRGAQHHRHPHGRQRCLAGCVSRRRDRPVPRREGFGFEGGLRVPGVMWWPGQIPAGQVLDEMMSHIDCGRRSPPWSASRRRPTGNGDDDGKPIYFDSIDNSAYVIGKAKHSARNSWIYIDGENFGAPAATSAAIRRTLTQHRLEISLHRQGHLARPGAEPRCHRPLYNLTMDPYEKYDMIFNGAMSTRMSTTSPGTYAGQDNGWALSLTISR